MFKPSSGDVYVLLYVDHHDAAYRWAENRKLAVNPITGAMQMVVLESVTETEVAPAPVLGRSHAATVSGVQAPLPRAVDVALFAEFGDRELLSLGVPENSLSAVTGRWLLKHSSTRCSSSRLPVEAYEGLFLLAAGDTVSQILEQQGNLDRSSGEYGRLCHRVGHFRSAIQVRHRQ